MIYVVTTFQGEELHRGESFPGAKQVADNHRRDTGINSTVESRTDVYTTQTLSEAMSEAMLSDFGGKAFPESVVVETDPKTGRRRAMPNHRQVGDHWPDFMG